MRFTSNSQDEMFDIEKEGGIVISTYHMMVQSLKDELKETCSKGALIRKKIGKVDWGLVILDEVH